MLMDRAYIDKNLIIDLYNLKKLNDEELEAFEIYILENPEIIKEIELNSVVCKTLKESKDLLKGSKRTNIAFYSKGFALAACLALALTFVINPQSKIEHSLQAPIILENFRGSEDLGLLVSGQPIVQLQVDVGPFEFIEENSFTIEVIEADTKQVIFSEKGLPADIDGWLNYSLMSQDSTILGIHEITVTNDKDSKQASTYRINFSN